MKWLEKLLKKKKKTIREPFILPPLMLSWEETKEFMHDKELGSEVVSVTYNKDNDRRYVIFKNQAGNYLFRFEKLYAYSEDANPDCMLYAYWCGFSESNARSVYASEKELLNQLKYEPAYKQYFEKEST